MKEKHDLGLLSLRVALKTSCLLNRCSNQLSFESTFLIHLLNTNDTYKSLRYCHIRKIVQQIEVQIIWYRVFVLMNSKHKEPCTREQFLYSQTRHNYCAKFTQVNNSIGYSVWLLSRRSKVQAVLLPTCQDYILSPCIEPINTNYIKNHMNIL